MQFHARVGLLPHEAELPQLIEIDVSVHCNIANTSTSNSNVPGVDYRELYDVAREIINSGHIELLEEIAQRISERALAMPGVNAARVAVRKPHAPLPGRIDYAEVVLERTNDV